MTISHASEGELCGSVSGTQSDTSILKYIPMELSSGGAWKNMLIYGKLSYLDIIVHALFRVALNKCYSNDKTELRGAWAKTKHCI